MADGLPIFPSFSFPSFGGPTGNESDEMLALRKRIAIGMLGRERRGYPKNIGEGLTSIGDALGEMGMMRQLAQSQAAVDARRETDPKLGPTSTPTVAPTQTSDASAAVAPGGPKLPVMAYDDTADTTPAPQQAAAAEPETPTPSPIGASAYGPTPTDVSSASYGSSIVPPMAPSPRNAIATAMLQPPTAPGVPQANPTQAGGASLPSSTDLGSSSALGGQPPDVMSDISKAPDVPLAPGAQMAQAVMPLAPGATPPPIQQPQVIPRVPIAPQATTLGPEPDAPKMPPMSEPQQKLQRLLNNPTITDPVRLRAFQSQFDAWEQQRKEDYEKLKANYERRRADWLTASAAENERKRMQTQTETAQQKSEQEIFQARQEAAKRQRLGDIPEPVWVKNLDESKKSIEPIINSVDSLQRAREAAKKMYTGQAADVNTFAASIMAAAGWPADPKLTATQQFKNAMTNMIAINRNAIVGTGAQSNKEFDTLLQASAADAKLQPETIMAALDAAQRLNLQTALAHQQLVRRYAGTEDPERMGAAYGAYGVRNIGAMIPKGGVDRLVKDYSNPNVDKNELFTDFDNTFHTPGLAEKLLRERHIYRPQGR